MKQILIEAANLFENFGWTRDASAQDSKGLPVEIESKSAASFCIAGAVMRVSESETYSKFRHLFVEKFKNTPTEWNDRICSSKEEAQAKLRELANLV